MIYVLGSTTVDMVAKVPYVPVSGETLRAEKFYSGVGGKGANQAVAVAKLGGSVKFIGKTGDDPNGRAVKEQLTASGVDTAHLGVSALPTATGMIMVINGDNRIVLSTGANFDFGEEDVDEGLADAKAGDYLVLQLEIPMETVVYAAEQAKKKKMTVILNPAPAASLPERLTENVDIICPNESETAILTGVEVKDELSLAAAVSALLRTGAKKAVITMGDKGAYIAEDGVITHIPDRQGLRLASAAAPLHNLPLRREQNAAEGILSQALLEASIHIGRQTFDRGFSALLALRQPGPGLLLRRKSFILRPREAAHRRFAALPGGEQSCLPSFSHSIYLPSCHRLLLFLPVQTLFFIIQGLAGCVNENAVYVLCVSQPSTQIL